MKQIFALLLVSSLALASPIKLYFNPNDYYASKYAHALRAQNFSVKVIKSFNFFAHKPNIANKYLSNITGFKDGYFFEGHVPTSMLKWLFDTKPKGVLGLSVPNYPAGSLGIQNGFLHEYSVYVFYKNGQVKKLASFLGKKRLDKEKL